MLHQLLISGTQSKNIILHTQMISTENPSTTFVESIVDKYPSLLEQVDAKGNTPLHVAAEQGYYDIAEVLTHYAKAKYVLGDMLKVENNENNTALHEAVIQGKTEVVKMLIKEAGPYFSYSSQKPALYLAFESGDNAMVVAMQGSWKSAAHKRPSASPDEMTALCAAATNYALLGN